MGTFPAASTAVATSSWAGGLAVEAPGNQSLQPALDLRPLLFAGALWVLSTRGRERPAPQVPGWCVRSG